MFHIVEQFVLHFLGMVASCIEDEAWANDSERIGADVCMKLAKVIAFKNASSRRFCRLYTGVLIAVGTTGRLLTAPQPIVRETGDVHERYLACNLQRKRTTLANSGAPRAGQPTLVTVGHPCFPLA